MNAQDMFKVHYRKAMAYRKAGYSSAARVAVSKAEEYLREAALERALEAERRENTRLRKDALKFSKAHSTGCPRCDNPSVDPQDWYEFDAAFGVVNNGTQ